MESVDLEGATCSENTTGLLDILQRGYIEMARSWGIRGGTTRTSGLIASSNPSY
jgi:hypothetical protein